MDRKQWHGIEFALTLNLQSTVLLLNGVNDSPNLCTPCLVEKHYALRDKITYMSFVINLSQEVYLIAAQIKL